MRIKRPLFQSFFNWQQLSFAAFYILLFIVYALLLPNDGLEYDRQCWKNWTIYIFQNGLSKVYHSDTNYMPGIHYISYLFGKMEGSAANIDRNINQLKLFVLPFDFLGGFYLVKIIKDKFHNSSTVFFYSLFFFLNVFYLYNTLVWGQADATFTAFLFISVYYALKEKTLLSMLSALLALNFKIQAIVFMPLIILLLIPLFIRQFSVKNLLIWIVVPSLFQLLIVLPFLLNGDMHLLLNVITGSVGKYPVISLEAYNIWSWLKPGNLWEFSDSGMFLSVSYKQWGLLLFFITSFFALLPLLLDVLKKKKIEVDKVLLIASILPLIFFYFNTEMHERYSHPAIIFIAAWSIQTRNFIPYILVSAAYFLNLEVFLQHFQLNYATIFFNAKFISGLYLIVILFLYFELYKANFSQRNKMGNTSIG